MLAGLVETKCRSELEWVRARLCVRGAAFVFRHHFEVVHPERDRPHADPDGSLDRNARGGATTYACFVV